MSREARQPQVGDRFKGYSVWEVIAVSGNNVRCVMVQAIHPDDISKNRVGLVSDFAKGALLSFFDYIGNYSKVDKFIELYEILAKDI